MKRLSRGRAATKLDKFTTPMQAGSLCSCDGVLIERTTEETTMDIFDNLHRAMFDRLFSLDDKSREEKAKLLRDAGFPEEVVADLCTPGIKPGMTLGGAKAIDVMTLVERVLFRQNAGHVLLRVSRPPFDEAGHVEISVIEIGRPSEEVAGEQASPEEPTP